jgi:hypothetical protein
MKRKATIAIEDRPPKASFERDVIVIIWIAGTLLVASWLLMIWTFVWPVGIG